MLTMTTRKARDLELPWAPPNRDVLSSVFMGVQEGSELLRQSTAPLLCQADQRTCEYVFRDTAIHPANVFPPICVRFIVAADGVHDVVQHGPRAQRLLVLV